MRHNLDIDVIGSAIWMPPDRDAAADFVEFSNTYSLEKFVCMREALNTAYESGRLKKLQGRGVAEFILSRKQERKPTSCVRVSDGEGNLLPLAFDFQIGDKLLDYCVKKISFMHFGEQRVVPDNSKEFGSFLAEAIRNADLLGFPNFGTIERGFHTEESKIDVRALTGNRLSYILLHRIGLEIGELGDVHSDAWFSRGLLPFYPDIVSDERRVGLISVYPELATKLNDAFGIPEVEFIRVPRQAIFAPHAERKNTYHYPDAMNRIIDEIRPNLQGQVFFVAAGLLGKRYCDRIKRNGGIAIDIGSIAEIWLGIKARGLEEEFINRWKL